MENKQFGTMPDGTPVEELTLTNGSLSCGILTYGGALRTLCVPDENGRPVDVVLGLDTLEDYRAQDKYLGALIGRYANRIGGSRFSLEGEDYPLRANDGANHLHGGLEGFDKRVWTVREQSRDAVTLTLFSPDGEEGYPGDLEVYVTYTLKDWDLEITYQAKSSKTTLCNLTNHAYFNLAGHGSGPITGQHIQILAGRYTPVGEGLIPTGTVEDVAGTAMDLRFLQPIGTREFDHNWALDGWEDDAVLRPAALAWSPETGIIMETLTTLPGIQFYTGNFLGGCPAGKGGAAYGRHGAFCLETQYFPDSPHQDHFPSTVLRTGETYSSKTVYRFRTGKKE
ncbi:MAG: galactose mutarotase [Oscillospiraceae bacterium]|nr:galactose mutarotase [Oscillospiraceae bacterium]